MRTSGHVAHCAPGSILLTPQAVDLLVKHLRTRRESDNPATRLVVADLIRLSRLRPPSRDGITVENLIARHSTMTTTDAAKHLGITPAGIRRRIQRGQLPAQFDGHRWHIKPTDLQERS